MAELTLLRCDRALHQVCLLGHWAQGYPGGLRATEELHGEGVQERDLHRLSLLPFRITPSSSPSSSLESFHLNKLTRFCCLASHLSLSLFLSTSCSLDAAVKHKAEGLLQAFNDQR